MALNASTGAIQWGQHALPYDVYNVGCVLNIPGVIQIPPNDNCPNPKGPDYDFGQGPMLFSNGFFGNNVGAGQKSGIFWAFNSTIGLPAWNTQVAPGGAFGGMQWGSAYAGARLYVAVSNAGGTGGTPPSAWNSRAGNVLSKRAAGSYSTFDR